MPSSENIFAIMEDWKRNAKKGDKDDENRFVFRLKTPMKGEEVVEDPVRVHLLYLEVPARSLTLFFFMLFFSFSFSFSFSSLWHL